MNYSVGYSETWSPDFKDEVRQSVFGVDLTLVFHTLKHVLLSSYVIGQFTETLSIALETLIAL